MGITMTQDSEEIKKAWDELRYELEKGIRDLEQGNVISADEAIRQIREELGLLNV